MPFEHSAGAILFYKGADGPEFLLLRYLRNGKEWWDYPKGHIELNEDKIETMKREVEEETGLTEIAIIPDFKTYVKYFFKEGDKNIFKIVDFYLAEAKAKEIRLSSEHAGYAWLSYEEAMKKLTYKNAKEVLKKAYEFLNAGK